MATTILDPVTPLAAASAAGPTNRGAGLGSDGHAHAHVRVHPHAGVHAQAGAADTMPRTLWAASGFSLALLVCFCAAALVDTRELVGANVWLKPAKFALSFFVLHATLAWAVERLSAPVRSGRVLHATVAALLIASTYELFYIGGRAGLGLSSHFAQATLLEAVAWALMGLGALTLVIGIAVIGWLARRDEGARFGPALRTGIVLGFIGSAVLTLVTAGTLSSLGGPLVGTPSPGAATLPLLGWSAEVGDLRPAHFLALHAMQVLPFVGWWIDRHGSALGQRGVHLAAIAWAALTAAVYVQALSGLPLLRVQA